MANQFTLAEILQNLTDEQLQGQMKAPSGEVPQFLVLSELQRRKAMRAEAADPPPPPTTTVADDLMASGIASTPEMSMGGEDVPDTGIASFAGGGEVVRFSTGDAVRGPSWLASAYPGGGGPSPEVIARMKARLRNGLDSVKSAIGGVSGYAADRARDVKDAAKNLYELGSTPVDQLEFKKPVNDLGKMTTVPGAFTGANRYLADRLGELNNGAKAVVNKLSPPVMGMDGIGLPTEWQAPPPDMVENPLNPPEESDVTAPARSGGGVRSLPVSSQMQPPPAAAMPQVGEAPKMPPMDELPAPPEFTKFDDHLARIQQEFPDVYADMIAKNEARMASAGDAKKDAVNMALMQAGLGMMASKNRSVLGALGEGGIGALSTFASSMRDAKREQADLQKHAESLRIAQQAAKQGNYRTAAEMKKNADAPLELDWNMRYKNTKEKNDRAYDEARIAQQYHREDIRDARAAQREQAAMDRLIYSQGQQNVRAAARAAGGGRGGKAADPLKTEDAAFRAVAARRKEYLSQVKEPPLASNEQKAQRLRDAEEYAMANVPGAYRKIVQQGAPAPVQQAPKKKINFADIK